MGGNYGEETEGPVPIRVRVPHTCTASATALEELEEDIGGNSPGQGVPRCLLSQQVYCRENESKPTYGPLVPSSGETAPGTSHSFFLTTQLSPLPQCPGLTVHPPPPASPVKDQRAKLAPLSLTYVPIEDGHQHIQSPVQPHEPQADDHHKLQSWISPRPQVAAQETELPAKVSPGRCWWPLC